ncbi:antitermination protein [Aggregatibacter aphrophilus]|uniref:antiterminator Q family protein n=1 Tax=Aggregatibacter aphrophilus TaxID=732 RepID=UPI0009F6703D|nr:antiterminator Q family protein [Aggregatibacter aphrophilus]PNL93784.1 antitermination protein [Aggregatibacter aphrophilus]
MKRFAELTLTEQQEEFVDEWMFKWGAWVRSGRLDKAQVNIIAKLMQSVASAEPGEQTCDDETGYMISQIVDRFFEKNDRTLRFIMFSYYVKKNTINRIAVKLRENCGEVKMQPCNGKSDIRIPSLKTVKRNVEKELKLAKAIIHELLVTGFVILRTGRQNAKSIKITY